MKIFHSFFILLFILGCSNKEEIINIKDKDEIVKRLNSKDFSVEEKEEIVVKLNSDKSQFPLPLFLGYLLNL